MYIAVCTANGDKGIRTLDPLLARQVLSQLSYIPKMLSHWIFFKKCPASTYLPVPLPAKYFRPLKS